MNTIKTQSMTIAAFVRRQVADLGLTNEVSVEPGRVTVIRFATRQSLEQIWAATSLELDSWNKGPRTASSARYANAYRRFLPVIERALDGAAA